MSDYATCFKCGGSLRGYPMDTGKHENLDDCIEFVGDQIQIAARTLDKMQAKKLWLVREKNIKPNQNEPT